jgi:hypothetical protein
VSVTIGSAGGRDRALARIAASERRRLVFVSRVLDSGNAGRLARTAYSLTAGLSETEIAERAAVI